MFNYRPRRRYMFSAIIGSLLGAASVFFFQKQINRAAKKLQIEKNVTRVTRVARQVKPRVAKAIKKIKRKIKNVA